MLHSDIVYTDLPMCYPHEMPNSNTSVISFASKGQCSHDLQNFVPSLQECLSLL